MNRTLLACAAIALLACGVGRAPVRVHDAAGQLPSGAAVALDRRLERLYRETGVDLQISFEVSVKSGEGLGIRAARRFAELGVAEKSPQARGLLFLYDVGSEMLHVELGLGMEEMLSDAFVGYLVEDHVRSLFDSDEPRMALLLAVRMIEHRLRRAALAGRFDPRPADPFPFSLHRSAGGGTAQNAPLGAAALPTLPRGTIPAAEQRFAAADTVEQCYQRYVEWLAGGVFDPTVAIFTPESRDLLRQFPITPAYLDFALQSEYGNDMAIVEQGDRALLYAVDDPLPAPHFLRRGTDGWQLDLVATSEEVVNLAGEPYAWTFLGPDGPNMRPFRDQLVRLGEALRLREGDNRPIPTFR